MGIAAYSQPEAASPGIARRVEEMYADHGRLVRSICRSLLRDRHEAEDAAQQTFLSAQRALENGSSPREPAAWLAAIARNECLARVRERMREPLAVEAEPTDVGADAHSAAVSRFEMATLGEALDDLPRAQREAILLREYRGLSYAEVGGVLSVTTTAVESLLFRARRTLQGRLTEVLSALSPLGLLGRLLGGGGGAAAPAVAKVAVIGVGAAIVAGGAAVGPRALGLGHSQTKTHISAPPAHVQVARPATATLSPTHTGAAASSERADTQPAEHEAPEIASSSDVVETSSPEAEKETADVPVVATPATPAPSSDDSADSGDSSSSGDSSGSDDPSASDNSGPGSDDSGSGSGD
jgi:RNA polymerase sigma-70 factor (ECF subfamily)